MTAGPQVVVLDYGSGNVHSVTRALAANGAQVTLTADPKLALSADGLVVPGVGAFAACMEQLVQVGGDDIIRRRQERGQAVLGICVGHQILFALGVEHGIAAQGVGLYGGTVELLPATRLPHMGWNEVQAPGPDRSGSVSPASSPAVALFEGIADQRFYFVHSYAALDASGVAADAQITWCRHEAADFIAAVEWGSVASTQFHPEKSGPAGGRLLRNWVSRL